MFSLASREIAATVLPVITLRCELEGTRLYIRKVFHLWTIRFLGGVMTNRNGRRLIHLLWQLFVIVEVLHLWLHSSTLNCFNGFLYTQHGMPWFPSWFISDLAQTSMCSVDILEGAEWCCRPNGVWEYLLGDYCSHCCFAVAFCVAPLFDLSSFFLFLIHRMF